jgi:hypothetical protein
VRAPWSHARSAGPQTISVHASCAPACRAAPRRAPRRAPAAAQREFSVGAQATDPVSTVSECVYTHQQPIMRRRVLSETCYIDSITFCTRSMKSLYASLEPILERHRVLLLLFICILRKSTIDLLEYLWSTCIDLRYMCRSKFRSTAVPPISSEFLNLLNLVYQQLY